MDTVLQSVSVQALASTLGTPNAPLIIDVRRAQAFDEDDSIIPSALRGVPDAISIWHPALIKERSIVAYCVHGHEVSQGAVRALIDAGLDARFLAGGIAAWREAGQPLLAKQSDLGVPAVVGSPSRWITRERPKIDRIACPWLIRRFIDPSAQFLYVPSNEVLETAKRERAVPYDVPSARLTHRGEECSFDAFIADFGLRDPVLDALAIIVRAADTGHLDDSPQAPGLAAVSLGLSALFADDLEMLERGMTVYDAFYAWIKSAREEVHNADLFKAKSP